MRIKISRILVEELDSVQNILSRNGIKLEEKGISLLLPNKRDAVPYYCLEFNVPKKMIIKGD